MTEKVILSNLSDFIPIIIKKIITTAIIIEIKFVLFIFAGRSDFLFKSTNPSTGGG